MIEISQNINPITITKRGEVLVYSETIKSKSKTYKLTIERSMTNNMYSLTSIAELLKIELKTLSNYIITQRFNFCIHCYDHSYKIPQYVYLIDFGDFIKIGRTFDINRRYPPKDLKDNLKRLVFVNDVVSTEKDLKVSFKNKFKKYSEDSDERFIITNMRSALKLFDDTVSKHNIKEIENTHIRHYDHDETYGSGYFVSPLACSLLISMYYELDYDICISFINNVEKLYNRIDKNDFIATFKEENMLFQYWKYYGYTIIVNINKEEVNISRLWKSIIKTDHDNIKGDTRLSKFLQRINIQNFMKENKIELHKRHYNDRPLLNGKYGSLLFVHIILYELNSKYAQRVAKMLTDMIFKRKIEIRNISGGTMNKNYILELFDKYSINFL